MKIAEIQHIRKNISRYLNTFQAKADHQCLCYLSETLAEVLQQHFNSFQPMSTLILLLLMINWYIVCSQSKSYVLITPIKAKRRYIENFSCQLTFINVILFHHNETVQLYLSCSGTCAWLYLLDLMVFQYFSIWYAYLFQSRLTQNLKICVNWHDLMFFQGYQKCLAFSFFIHSFVGLVCLHYNSSNVRLWVAP